MFKIHVLFILILIFVQDMIRCQVKNSCSGVQCKCCENIRCHSRLAYDRNRPLYNKKNSILSTIDSKTGHVERLVQINMNFGCKYELLSS